ncbi:MAG TPA: hypothetical protein VK673_12245 [Chthoniobacterales bacterium]|nr:hypothetical protein [Chthoniobacterales bacterium]
MLQILTPGLPSIKRRLRRPTATDQSGTSNPQQLQSSQDAKWPVRKWEPSGEAKVVRLRTPNLFAVAQPFTWTVADGSRHHAHGNATLYLRVRRNSQGDYQIIYIRQFQH